MMAKHPMSDALDKAEAYLKQRQAERRLADAAPDLMLLVRRALLQPKAVYDPAWVNRARAVIAKADGRDA